MNDAATQPSNAPELTEEKVKSTYTLAELLAMSDEDLGEQFLFGNYLLKSGLAVVVGGSDTGKSTLLRQMCMSVATGRDFLGWKYKGTRHRAIYFSSEDDMKLTARVVKSYNKTMKLPQAATENLFFEFDWDCDTIADRVRKMVTSTPADLIVIDAFGDAFNGKNMNDNKEVRKFYEPFRKIAADFDCLIIFNHHTGKRTSVYAPDKDNALGSQAIEAAPRLAIELRTDPNDPDTIHLCIVKANYLPPKEKNQSFVLRRDENVVFYATGDRVDFVELAKNNKPEQGRKAKAPAMIDDAIHRQFIRSAFVDGNINQTKLRTLIEAEFEISNRTADKFITYYVSKKRWVEEAGKGKFNSIIYRSNIVW